MQDMEGDTAAEKVEQEKKINPKQVGQET
jgi:hypothetical protein